MAKKSFIALIPDDEWPNDGVLVSGVQDLDVEVIRVRVDHEEHEALLEHGVSVVIQRPAIKIQE